MKKLAARYPHDSVTVGDVVVTSTPTEFEDADGILDAVAEAGIADLVVVVEDPADVSETEPEPEPVVSPVSLDGRRRNNPNKEK